MAECRQCGEKIEKGTARLGKARKGTGFAFKLMNYVPNVMNFVLRVMNSLLRMMELLLNTMDFVTKYAKVQRTIAARLGGLRHGCT